MANLRGNMTKEMVINLWQKGLMPEHIAEETCLDIKLVEEIIESEIYYKEEQ